MPVALDKVCKPCLVILSNHARRIPRLCRFVTSAHGFKPAGTRMLYRHLMPCFVCFGYITTVRSKEMFSGEFLAFQVSDQQVSRSGGKNGIAILTHTAYTHCVHHHGFLFFVLHPITLAPVFAALRIFYDADSAITFLLRYAHLLFFQATASELSRFSKSSTTTRRAS